MHDPREVRGGERLADLRGVAQRLVERQAARDRPVERLALDEFHRDEVQLVGAVDLVDGDDVGVVERRGRAGLVLEAAAPLVVRGQLRRQQLERDAPLQP